MLAYNGGLDTSVAVRWLKEKYNLDIIALTVDVGNERCFSRGRSVIRSFTSSTAMSQLKL